MCQTNSIRDVIAFPKSVDGKDHLSNAPCEISTNELELYHLSIKKWNNKIEIKEKTFEVLKKMIYLFDKKADNKKKLYPNL